MVLSRFLAKVSTRSDLPDPSKKLSASDSHAKIKQTIDTVSTSAISCACAQFSTAKAYDIKNYENLF